MKLSLAVKNILYSKNQLKESIEDFYDNDHEYWDKDAFKRINMMQPLEFLVEFTHDIKTKKVIDSKYKTPEEITLFLEETIKNLEDAVDKFKNRTQ